MIEGREFDKSPIGISSDAPSWDHCAEIVQALSSSSGNNMDRSVYDAGVVMFFWIYTLILQYEIRQTEMLVLSCRFCQQLKKKKDCNEISFIRILDRS